MASDNQKHTDHILQCHTEVLEHIIHGHSLPVILDKLCREIEQYFGSGVLAFILLMDEAGCQLRYGAGPSLSESYKRATDGIMIGPEVASCAAAAYLKESVIVPDISTHPNWVKYKDLAESHGLRACWSMPILTGDGQVLGTFGMFYTVPRAPTDEEKAYVEFLAHSASIAIDKVQARERLQQQTYALETVNRIGCTLAAELNVEKLVQSVTDACRELSGAEFVAFFYKVLDENGESLLLYTMSGVPREAFEHFPMPRNTPIFAPTFSGEAVVRIADVTVDPRYGQMPPYFGMPPGHPPVRSYLAVPVVSRSGEVLGGLFFGHSLPNVFTPKVETVVTGIASQTAIAMDNARLYQTAQKEIEERKQVSENLRRLASIVESSQDAIYSLTMNGVITSWNNGAERMYGYPASEMVDQFFSLLLLPDSRQDASVQLGLLLKKNEVPIQDALRMKKDGTVFSVSLSISPIVDVDGVLIGHSLIERDVSEQKRIGDALRESEGRFRTMWDNSPAVKFVKDLEGKYQLINKQFETVFRLPREAILGKTDLELLNVPDAQLLRAHDREILNSRIPQEFEETVALPDGVATYLSVKFPLYDADGRPNALCGIGTDITARKQAEQALQELNDSLEQRVADRTRALVAYQENLRAMTSELVVTEQRERRRLATDLHDYLAQLLVVGRMKLTQATKQVAHDVTFSVLQGHLEEIDHILADSLTYTRTLIAELSPTILYELGLGPALRWLGQQMESHGLLVQVEDSGQVMLLPEDQGLFVYQAVRELLFNIIKHSGVREATVSFTGHTDQELEVLVQDAGQGFQPALQSTDYTYPGRFGLFSIRERAEGLGGRFHIDSAPGQGTQARIVFPLHSRPEEMSEDNKIKKTSKSFNLPLAGPLKTKAIRILLVDDHAMIREGIRTLLEHQANFIIVGEAKNGKEALEMTKLVHPDVVIMDVNMPMINGIEATRLLTKDYSSVRVIGLSVHEDKQVEKLLLEAGAAMYVSKSSVASRLVVAIGEVMNQSH